MKKILALACCLSANSSSACTTFFLSTPQTLTYGRNLDWATGHGALILNKRNISKSAFNLSEPGTPMHWISKYGSVSFNQVGREFPYGGVNEKGLVVEVLVWGGSQYPDLNSSDLAINEAQWVQYQLDSAGTLREAIDLATHVNIVDIFIPLHYLVCDSSSGSCAVFEYVNHSLKIYSGADIEVASLANDSYGDSLKKLHTYMGFGGSKSLPSGLGSFARFARASAAVKNYKGEEPISYAFNTLKSVADGETQWSVVYDLKQSRVYFKNRAHPGITSYVDFANQLGASCKTPVKVYDLESKQSGDVTNLLQDESAKFNEDLVQKSSFLPQILRNEITKYPSTTQCLD